MTKLSLEIAAYTAMTERGRNKIRIKKLEVSDETDK